MSSFLPVSPASEKERLEIEEEDKERKVWDKYARADDEMFDPFVIAHRIRENSTLGRESSPIVSEDVDQLRRRPGSALSPQPVESIQRMAGNRAMIAADQQQNNNNNNNNSEQQTQQRKIVVGAEGQLIDVSDKNNQSEITYEEFYHYAPGHRPLSAELSHRRLNYQNQLKNLKKQQQQNIEATCEASSSDSVFVQNAAAAAAAGDSMKIVERPHTPEYTVCKRIIDRENGVVVSDSEQQQQEASVATDRQLIIAAAESENETVEEDEHTWKNQAKKGQEGLNDNEDDNDDGLSPNNQSRRRRREIVKQIQQQKKCRLEEESRILNGQARTRGYQASLTIESDDLIKKEQKKLGAFDIPCRVRDAKVLKKMLTPHPFPSTLLADLTANKKE